MGEITMGFIEYLTESPRLIDPVDFNLSDRKWNNKFSEELLAKKNKEIYDETDKHILFRTGNDAKGYISLINKELTRIDYIVNYDQTNSKVLGRYVTQIAVWRSKGGFESYKNSDSVTRDVFFNILLKKYGTIVSDTEQTENGRDFWIRMLHRAVTRHDFKIGLMKVGIKDVEWYEGNSDGDLADWMDDHYYAWTREMKGKTLRFVISDEK